MSGRCRGMRHAFVFSAAIAAWSVVAALEVHSVGHEQQQQLRELQQEQRQQRYLRSKDVPGWGGPTWGGRDFSDSIANYNPWSRVHKGPIIQELDPVAPFDRLDKQGSTSLTGAAPLAPTDEVNGQVGPPTLQSDYLSPYSFPHTFPADKDPANMDPSSPILRIADRNLISSADKLRPPYAWRASGNYPLVAPADRMISSRDRARGWIKGAQAENNPWPTGATDHVDESFARYFQEVHDREQQRLDAIRIDGLYAAADGDKDGTISRQEYDRLLRDHQNKTAEEAEKLWGRYHTSAFDSLTKPEFQALARNGFDLGVISRADISSVINLPGGPHVGFWGSGAKCAVGSYVVGAKLKVQPLSKSQDQDDTALNAVGLKCSDGREVQTVEGPHGSWTEWALCPEGQRVFSVRARAMPYEIGMDNSALASLELGCRQPDLGKMSRLQFRDSDGPKNRPKNPFLINGKGAMAKGGGWTKEFMCGPDSAICGAQAHVVRDQGKGDDLGLADLRVYCCNAPVNCTAACGPPDGEVSVKCQVCHVAAGVKDSHPAITANAGVKARVQSVEDFSGGRRRRSVMLPPLPSELVPLPSNFIPDVPSVSIIAPKWSY